MSQRVQEIIAPLKRRQIRVRVADLSRRVGVRYADGPNVVLRAELADELDAAHDVALEGGTGVECLNDVHIRQNVFQRAQRDVLASESIKGVWNLHDATLIFDALDGFFGGEATRDVLLKKQADNLAVRRPQFSPDDYRKGRDFPHRQRALNRVVVRDGYEVDALALACGYERLRGELGIRRDPRVDMKIGSHRMSVARAGGSARLPVYARST